MRDYRSRSKEPEPQSVNLEHCAEIEDKRVGKATYDRWAAGRQIAFAFGIPDDEEAA